MLNKSVLGLVSLLGIGLLPDVANAQQAQRLQLVGTWVFADARQQETDEGLRFCFQANSLTRLQHPQLRRLEGNLCVTNPLKALGDMKVTLPQLAPTCAFRGEGSGWLTVQGLRVLPEDEMYEERIEATLVELSFPKIIQSFRTVCGYGDEEQEEVATVFDDVRHAIDSNPDFSEMLSAYSQYVPEHSYMTLGVEHTIWLPNGKADVVVWMAEGNSALHQLTVHRQVNGQWRNDSALLLPGYQNELDNPPRGGWRWRGTNYSLQLRNGAPYLHRLDTGREYRYDGKSFVEVR